MVAPLCWATTHSRGCIRDPERRSTPWRGVERRQQGKRARKERARRNKFRARRRGVHPGELRKIRRSLLENVWKNTSGWNIAGNPALSTGNGRRNFVPRLQRLTRDVRASSVRQSCYGRSPGVQCPSPASPKLFRVRDLALGYINKSWRPRLPAERQSHTSRHSE